MLPSPVIGHCCGNSFVVYDGTTKVIPDIHKPDLARKAIVEHGVDSALFIESSDSADILLRIFERDGTESDCCGNGALLVAASNGLLTGRIATKGGTLSIICEANRLALLLDIAALTSHSSHLHNFPCVHVNCGEPHLVLVEQEEASVDLSHLGALAQERYSQGMNVSIISCKDRATYTIRTYERGVNGLTKSCGTAALAAHCALLFLGQIRNESRIEFISHGGTHWVSRNNSHVLLEVHRKDCMPWRVL